jgi:hypothetical protein
VFPATFEIPEREHKIGSGGRFEYMLNGTVDLEMKSGEKTAAQWAGRAVLGEVDGKLKYLFYQVFLRL